ncbi:MAG: GNAT family N-acetyltransferase [Anaerolineaceae bacterium]|nr:GNAT family N-acetyltransferase [Anaerolineaceae bacterium]
MKAAAVSSLTITPYQRRHLQPIRDLLFHSSFVHTHLDWLDSDQWLEAGESMTLLAWQRGRLVGVLGLSSPLNGSTWIRLAGIADYVDPEHILCLLWDEFVPRLRQMDIHTVGLLIVSEWMSRYAPAMGFQFGEEIITLARSGLEIPTALPNRPRIRVAEMRDIPQLAALDQAAFEPPWQMSLYDLRQAYRIASSCTVAVKDERILGFQVSTFFFDGAHLARLAVHPHAQGQGVGGTLLGDLLERYARRGIRMMTVNTQESNLQSRRLYDRFGFEINGYNLPYWSTHL